MNKKFWIVSLLSILLACSSIVYAADTKLSALPSATLTDGDEIYVNDGGTSTKATVAELRTALGGIGFIPLDITQLRTLVTDEVVVKATAPGGGALAFDTVPILERTATTTDKSLRVVWILSVSDEVFFPPIPMPPDLDETADVTVHLVAELSGSTDDGLVIDIQAWDGVGDTEMGGNSTAINDAVGEVTTTLAAANISGHPTGFLNLQLVPGAHTTDDLWLYTAWIEYTKK